MIEEYGTVVELKGKQTAVVVCEKNSFCANCASMEACRLGDDNRSMLVDAHNPLDAQVGDKVKVVTSSKSFLQSSFILYIVPLLALIVGAALGQTFGERLETGTDPNLFSALVGIAFLVGSFLIIRLASRLIPRAAFMPRIAEIMRDDESANGTHGH